LHGERIDPESGTRSPTPLSRHLDCAVTHCGDSSGICRQNRRVSAMQRLEEEVFLARRPAGKPARKPRSPGDYEAELVRLCKGNRQLAEDLIAAEQGNSAGSSRQGAALALVTRMRHEKKPPKARL
jgi:hypothetical protein